ncbi:MAG: hypothetical protein ACJ749_04290 [Flavisolibacter sp.]
MKTTIFSFAIALLFSGCNKTADKIIDKGFSSQHDLSKFIKYTIQQGNQFCDQNEFAAVETNEMNFIVVFDSSAIYQTALAENQDDINKLYGFSDNNSEHHKFSARFGWRWSNNALRLFAYVYNEAEMTSKEITTVDPGKEINCSIVVKGNRYVFTVNDRTQEMPRMATTDNGKGYQLYPYFGGDESAPHEINIWIRALDSSHSR